MPLKHKLGELIFLMEWKDERFELMDIRDRFRGTTRSMLTP